VDDDVIFFVLDQDYMFPLLQFSFKNHFELYFSSSCFRLILSYVRPTLEYIFAIINRANYK
jgi:hypothetical protein